MFNQEAVERPAYYAVIPANVRYDKKITALAKLLYAEITALCNKEGFCWATSNYFADLYQVSRVTVSRTISQLVKAGYIKSKVEGGYKRKIFLAEGVSKMRQGYNKNATPPRIKNVTHNNTSINTTNNNNTDVEKKADRIVRWAYKRAAVQPSCTPESFKYSVVKAMQRVGAEKVWREFERETNAISFLTSIKTM
jgi:DNA-binding transcriptional MocR family regulator